MTHVLTTLVAVTLLNASGVWADDQQHRPPAMPTVEQCWQLFPFDDTIRVTRSPLEIEDENRRKRHAPPAPSFFWLAIHWQGLDVYELDGGGTATDNLPAQTLTLDIVLHNPSPFFGGHPICRLTIATGPELTGPWATDCLGATPPFQGGTPYLVQGTLTPIACADEASLQSMAPLSQGGRLAGIP